MKDLDQNNSSIQLEFLFVDFKETYMYRYEKSKAGIPSGK